MKAFTEKNKKKKLLVYEIPLLVESKLMRNFNLVWFVSSKKKIRLKRYINKGGGKKMFMFLNNRQIKNSKKIRYADYVIINNKSLKHLKNQISGIEDL